MEHLQRELDQLLANLPDEEDVRNRLESLVSAYPFNEYEYIIATLLAMDALTLERYHALRNEYVARNPYLHIFEITSPTGFGTIWAGDHLKKLVPELIKPSKKLDPEYSPQQYDFFLDGKIRIEVKASRAVDADVAAPLYAKALLSGSTKNFEMNFQQKKPDCCDVFVWIAVWRDVIRYWVLSSLEVETNQYHSKGQHRGNVGEGQLHVTQKNINDFNKYETKPNNLASAIRAAYDRQQESRTE